MVAKKRTGVTILLVLSTGLFTAYTEARARRSRASTDKSVRHPSSFSRRARAGQRRQRQTSSLSPSRTPRQDSAGARQRRSGGRSQGPNVRNQASSAEYRGSQIRNRVSSTDCRSSHSRRHGRHTYWRSCYYFGLPYTGYYYAYPYLRYYYGYPYRYYCGYPYRYFGFPFDRYYYRERFYVRPYVPESEKRRRESRYDSRRDATEELQPQPEPPDEQSQRVQLDEQLQDIADAFADCNYTEAARRAGEALNADPDNQVLPFLYSQSLFADQEYGAAASVLRQALTHVDVEEDGVYYSTGFYPDRERLEQQIQDLIETAKAEPSNADLQLVLGYQLLGVGRFEGALEALQTAERDYVNRRAATVLIDVLEKGRSNY